MNLLRIFYRPPDFIIGGTERPYMLRWFVIPRNAWLNIYLHKFIRDDDDRAFHDHPWWFMSLMLWGKYLEWRPTGVRARSWLSLVFRRATDQHRVTLVDGQPCWTLVVTGPRVREWGFYCPQGWRHWKEFVGERDQGAVGRGCE